MWLGMHRGEPLDPENDKNAAARQILGSHFFPTSPPISRLRGVTRIVTYANCAAPEKMYGGGRSLERTALPQIFSANREIYREIARFAPTLYTQLPG
jgi:hypothetical protein